MSQIIFESKLTIKEAGTSKVTETKKQVAFTEIESKRYVIAANGSGVLWDPGTDSADAFGDFDFLYLMADGTVDIEFTVNEGNAAEQLFTIRLAAKVPLVLGADDSFYSLVAGEAAPDDGTLAVIDKIRYDEPTGVAVNLTMIIAS